MKLLCVVVVLLLSVCAASADKAVQTVEPVTGPPGSEYTHTQEYSTRAPLIIDNVANITTTGGVLIYSNSAPFTVPGDDVKPDIGIDFPPTVGASTVSATATLQDGSVVDVVPGPAGDVSHFFGDVFPGQLIILSALKLVL